MVSYKNFLQEIRSNHTLNPKVSAMDALEPYHHKGYYCHFTDIDKVGVHPKTRWNTPGGIYAYPLDYVIDKQLEVEFRENSKNIFILKPRIRPIIFPLSQQQYTSMLGDIKKYLMVVTDATSPHVDAAIEACRKNALHPNNNSVIWNITRVGEILIKKCKRFNIPISDYNREYRYIERNVNIWNWNKTLRNLKMNVIVDNGTGTIHENEPHQVFITDVTMVDVVNKINNRPEEVIIPPTEFINKLVSNKIEIYFGSIGYIVLWEREKGEEATDKRIRSISSDYYRSVVKTPSFNAFLKSNYRHTSQLAYDNFIAMVVIAIFHGRTIDSTIIEELSDESMFNRCMAYYELTKSNEIKI